MCVFLSEFGLPLSISTIERVGALEILVFVYQTAPSHIAKDRDVRKSIGYPYLNGILRLSWSILLCQCNNFGVGLCKMSVR